MNNHFHDGTNLRIRFEKTLSAPPDYFLEKFKKAKAASSPLYKIKMLDRHVWLSMGTSEKKYYSPTLHLEFEPIDDGSKTLLRGLFGPEAGLWTMFMFLHFVVAGIFIMFLTFAYSNWVMHQSYVLDIIVMILMLVAWFALYFFARLNRKNGMPQARKLNRLMEEVLGNNDT